MSSGFPCPRCEAESVTYDNINHSSCDECGERVPNAHLRGLTMDNSSTTTVRKRRGYRPMNIERNALRMDWEEYILYALEVELEDVNEDALSELGQALESWSW